MSPRSLAVSLALVNAAIVALVALTLSANTDRRVQLQQRAAAAVVEREVTRQVVPEVKAEVNDQLDERLPGTATTTIPPAHLPPVQQPIDRVTTTTEPRPFDLTTTTTAPTVTAPTVTLPTVVPSVPPLPLP